MRKSCKHYKKNILMVPGHFHNLMTIKFGENIAGPHLNHSFMSSAPRTPIYVVDHIMTNSKTRGSSCGS